SAVAERVGEVGAGHRPEERQVVRGDVDRTAPGSFDPRGGETGKQPTQSTFGTCGRRGVVREAAVDPPTEPDRSGPAAHQHSAVVRRAEVMEEHSSVDNRLTPRPTDLLEHFR